MADIFAREFKCLPSVVNGLKVRVDGGKVEVTGPDGKPIPMVQKLVLSVDAETMLWRAEVHCLVTDLVVERVEADGTVFVHGPDGKVVRQYHLPEPAVKKGGENAKPLGRRPVPPPAPPPVR